MTMDAQHTAFPGIPLPDRSAKPRARGITMMIDWGLPLGAQADTLGLSGEIIDIAKVAVGISGLLPQSVLAAKIDLYRRHAVEAFPGGMFLEYAFAKGVADAFFRGCASAGYRYVEVSDNAVPLSRKDKDGLIGEARERGFGVLGEAGSKHATTEPGVLVADINGCLAAGAWKVFLEAAELFEGGQLRHDLLDRIGGEVDPGAVIWELPGHWIPGIHAHEIHALAVWLIEHLGADVNIANVAPESLMALEALRRGIGVRTLVGEQVSSVMPR
jgi:phosphosulfolactate synthase